MSEFLPSPSSEGASIGVFLTRMGIAFVLGALIAWRPLSRLAGWRCRKMAVEYALLLMTMTAALVTGVIGDSLARAFGVVGLGAVIRFRTSIKDPCDVVLFFLSIGVGMACGLGLLAYAAVGVAVLSLVLIPRDRWIPKAPAAE